MARRSCFRSGIWAEKARRRGAADDLDARGLKRPGFVIVDGAPGLEAALSALWGDDLPVQRCTVHKHRNPRLAFGPNAIGSAITFAHALIRANDIDGTRKIIDFSADSANNWGGVPIFDARALALGDGLTINGLAILCRGDCGGRPVSYNVEQAFAETIIGGPGSFVVTADGRDSFAAAVRRKLILEIADRGGNESRSEVRPSG